MFGKQRFFCTNELQRVYSGLSESNGEDFDTKEAAMTTNAHRETATIYIFPTRARVRADTFEAQADAVASLASKRIANVAFDAWYHEEAIAEASRDKGN